MLIAPSKEVLAVVVPSSSIHSPSINCRCRTSKSPFRKSKSPVALVHVVMRISLTAKPDKAWQSFQLLSSHAFEPALVDPAVAADPQAADRARAGRRARGVAANH